MAGIARLKGTIKHYDWGGNTFIPRLLQLKEVGDKRYAEYWLGTHSQATCELEFSDGSSTPFTEYMQKQPAILLGDPVYKNFGALPYLLKALDVRDMLSIQVHPSREAARRDFAAENEKGVPLNSPERNYKDDNHKPELMYAMSDFWLLHGFKPEAELRRVLKRVKPLHFLAKIFDDGGYTSVYRRVMEMPQEDVNRILQPLLDEIVPSYNSGELDKDNEDFWAARASLTFSRPGTIDRGIFSIYLFNLVYVPKGSAVFQDAGVPHAYLEGQNIEIMANSDNVLRGGLTTKHIDVHELIKHVRCEPTIPRIFEGEKMGDAIVFKTPAPDFELSSYSLGKGQLISISADTTEIFLLVEGECTLKTNESAVTIKAGSPSAVLFPGVPATLFAASDSLVFKASVPVDK